jgi:hypothetical protein
MLRTHHFYRRKSGSPSTGSSQCSRLPEIFRRLLLEPQVADTLLTRLVNALRYVGFYLRSPATLAAENLFLRKHLAPYRERDVKPRRATPATHIALIGLARWFDWRRALVIVQPQTLTQWHR